MTQPTDHFRYTFGEFTLDTRRGAILRGTEEVTLRRQSFEVLKLLVSRHGALVTKSELHAEIWGDRVVTDDSLTHCLLDIRKALGDTDKSIIRTVPRRGYVFELACIVEPIVDTKNLHTPQNRRPGWGLAPISAIAATIAVLWLLDIGNIQSFNLTRERSIAVLPFVDLSPLQDQAYLGDGMSDEVLNLLARSPDLRVIARTSSFALADQSPDIATIRDKLDVDYVLEGSVLQTGDRLKVSARLVDTADSSNIWSDRYERHARETLAIQSEIAAAILTEIAPETDQSASTPASRNFSANELMLLARFYEQEVRELPNVDHDLLARAVNLYRDAVAADPGSAIAHSRLASAHLYGGDIAAAEAPTLKAIELDSELSEVQETLGQYYWLQGLPGAGAAWKRAIELNPNNTNALSAYAYWNWMQGDSEEPIRLYRRALELDPLSLARFGALGEGYAHLARVDEAQDIASQIEQEFGSAAAFRTIARLMELTGKVDESIAWTIRARDLEPDNPEHVYALAELFAELGDFATALELEPEAGVGLLYKMRRYDDVIDVGELRMIEYPEDIELRYALAFAYNATDNPRAAIRILRGTGLPATVRPEARHARDIEAFVTLIDALDAVGNLAEARDLADWWEARRHTDNDNWWILLHRACPLATNGHPAAALDLLDRVPNSPRLPWELHIRDMRCFQRFADEPRYQDMLDKITARRAAVLARLPDTLRAFDVEL